MTSPQMTPTTDRGAGLRGPGDPAESDLDALDRARHQTDSLFGLIENGDLYIRPLPQRHRLIFYLGHLEAFDWNHAARFGLSESEFHKSFDGLFARGIDPEPGQLPSDTERDWPSIEEAKQYVRNVRQRLNELWANVPPDLRDMTIEHRLMHAETLAYQLHNLPYEQKRMPKAGETASPPSIVDHRMITIPAGSATLGKPREAGFGWDNEFNEHAVDVPEFAISKYKVTNGEYLAFVEQGAAAPFFWTRSDGEWRYRGMFGEIPLPMNAPVYVTYSEASAYAGWRGMKLPSEVQFHRAAYGTPEGDERLFPWGSDSAHPEAFGNFDFRHWDPVAVTDYPGGKSAFGVAQLVGNGWEWTRTPFAPFPGFEPHVNYPGYSADFFDEKHFVMKGASPQTAAKLTRRSLRNWFRPDYPYVYATFRLVEE